MKKHILTAIATSAFTLPVIAEETETIDPSDLTRVYTQAAVFVTSDADVRLSSMLTGAWTENIQFGGFLEANFGDSQAKAGKDTLGADYLGSRAQYFQVSGIDNTLFPRVGFMADIIHQRNEGLSDTTLYSIGAIGSINPEYTGGIMVFPNVNYTTGKVFGESAKGYMLNVFATIPMGYTGAFIQAWPEYFTVSGDTVEMESTAYNLMFNAPLKTDRTQWLMTKLQYASANIVTPTGIHLDGDYELKAEVGVKWFF
ncbi:hypothetical protein VINI7043_10946 [Vibrio nigripulchritudo ATCC 27043]|uniref:hypothetical protein n=1 Tax=Vibrio nigripulchritudo TaxID=28173 RepID=UPI00021C1C3D|nr:hypothetical protein [Vibrio nigripulchritudo]EGU55625.1 hypothetical protein VINI7043_10946 [Vibrio nigripulchritudo ATCC 27043]